MSIIVLRKIKNQIINTINQVKSNQLNPDQSKQIYKKNRIFDPTFRKSMDKNNFNLIKDPQQKQLPVFEQGRNSKLNKLKFYHFQQQKNNEIPYHKIYDDLPIMTARKREKHKEPSPNTYREKQDKASQYKALSRLQTHRKSVDLSLQIKKSQFTLEFVVGKGGFGKVWKIKQKKSGQIFAMKQMYKAKIIQKKSVNSVMNQRSLLSNLNHSFLVNMKYAFQDRQNLYLVLDYLNGGDLRYHMSIKKKFSEQQAKFFICCIIIGLQYIHSNNIIHRDIKPQNLVFDNKGYIRITDFGVSRENREKNAEDTSGTPGYMSPEVICKSDHSFPADYFALGIILYELMLNKRPYIGKNRKQIRDMMIAKQARIQEVPIGWSIQAVDLANKLIQRKPESRLGYNGISQIKNHFWFKNFDWNGLNKKQMKSPYKINTIEDDYDKYKQCISQDSQIWNQEQITLLLRNTQTQQLFNGYQYDRRIEENRTMITTRDSPRYSSRSRNRKF